MATRQLAIALAAAANSGKPNSASTSSLGKVYRYCVVGVVGLVGVSDTALKISKVCTSERRVKTLHRVIDINQ